MRNNDRGARACTTAFLVALPGGKDLASALSQHYLIRTEPARPGRQLRYIATARRPGVSPHTLVTADPAELLAALTQQPRPAYSPAVLSAVRIGGPR